MEIKVLDVIVLIIFGGFEFGCFWFWMIVIVRILFFFCLILLLEMMYFYVLGWGVICNDMLIGDIGGGGGSIIY